MTWTYGGDPTLSATDQVRFLIGDTDPNTPRVQDEELQFALYIHTNPWLAGAVIAESLAARAAAEVNQSIGELREEAAARQEKYERVAAMLRGYVANWAGSGDGPGGGGSMFPADFALPWAGGLDIPRAFDFSAERAYDGRSSSRLAPGTEGEWGPFGPRFPWE